MAPAEAGAAHATTGAADAAGGGVGGGQAAEGVPVVLGETIEEVRVHTTSVRLRRTLDEWQE